MALFRLDAPRNVTGSPKKSSSVVVVEFCSLSTLAALLLLLLLLFHRPGPGRMAASRAREGSALLLGCSLVALDEILRWHLFKRSEGMRREGKTDLDVFIASRLQSAGCYELRVVESLDLIVFMPF